jgi:hypothetical protein
MKRSIYKGLATVVAASVLIASINAYNTYSINEDSKSIYLQTYKQDIKVTKFDDLNECLSQNAEHSVTETLIDSPFSMFKYKYFRSCEFIFKRASEIHSLYGNPHKDIAGVAAFTTEDSYRFYPLYRDDRNNFIYFFGPLYERSGSLSLSDIEQYNDNIKEASLVSYIEP